MLAAGPALSALLTAALAGTRGLEARRFDSQAALIAHMRRAPVDLLVCDFDCAACPPPELARALRTEVRRPIEIIALCGSIGPGTQAIATACGIDEVIAKPLSPTYLVERVLARLRRSAPVPPERAVLKANVVQLFGDRQAPVH